MRFVLSFLKIAARTRYQQSRLESRQKDGMGMMEGFTTSSGASYVCIVGRRTKRPESWQVLAQRLNAPWDRPEGVEGLAPSREEAICQARLAAEAHEARRPR